MNRFHAAIVFAALLPLTGCGRKDPPPPPAADSTATADSAIARKIQDALAQASEKLATANIPVGGDFHHGIRFGRSGNDGLPRAEITPQGDLLIDGKAVDVDEQQRKLLLEHRANLVAVAQAGIAVGAQGAALGMQGAALGMKAAAGALKSAISGNGEEFEKRMEAEGQRIEAEGRRIEAEAERMVCSRLPAVLASQQALAAALPAFAPYATMDESDIDDCGKDDDSDSGEDSASDQADTNSGEPAMDAAAEADAAAKDASTK